jgi:hypothetical protein
MARKRMGEAHIFLAVRSKSKVKIIHKYYYIQGYQLSKTMRILESVSGCILQGYLRSNSQKGIWLKI